MTGNGNRMRANGPGCLWCFRAVVAGVLALCSGFMCHAAEEVGSVQENVVQMNVSATDAYGREARGQINVTTFRPAGATGRLPVVVVNHGRPSDALRAAMVRTRFSRVSPELARRGFLVVVPTRLGYGQQAAGADPEDMGSCDNPRYLAAFDAVGSQIRAVVNQIKQWPDVDDQRIFVFGHSVGGMGAVSSATLSDSGIRAVVNFSGGHGGRPQSWPGEPCSSAALVRSAQVLGARRSPVPGLWMYVQNDRYFSVENARTWFDAHTQAGGVAEFIAMPAFGSDGHDLFEKAPAQWLPAVLSFLERSVGVATSTPASAAVAATATAPASTPSPTGTAALDDLAALPMLTPLMRLDYRRFLASAKPRAFAIGDAPGFHAYATGDNASVQALRACERGQSVKCRLYAVDDGVVWSQ